MKSNSKFFNLLLLLPAVLIAGCGGNPSSSSSEVSSSSSSEVSSSSSELPPSRANPIVINLEDATTTFKKELVGPFVILTESGETPTLTVDGSGSKKTNIPTSYENMYEAIRVAGKNSTTRNILQVQDQNFVQIYKRIKTSICYVFNGPDYVGTVGQATAKKYCVNNPKAYAINGVASDYYFLGRDDMVKNQTVQENVLETYAGAYNYMFSKGGSSVKDLGYRYCSADIMLSKCTYIPPSDGGTWNAYMFINLAEGMSADLGLIGVYRGDHAEWWLFRSCSSKCHTAGGSTEKDAPFYVFQNTWITKSTKYDSTTRACTGFDDLHFEAMTCNDGWILNITNLTTKKVLNLDHHHTDAQGAKVEENTTGLGSRALIAASYCPVTNNVWNWDNGAVLNDVIWTNITLKKAIKKQDGTFSQDIEDYRNEETSYELYPDAATYRDGYSQGAYKSSHKFDKFTESGTLASGLKYFKNQKYISMSVDYRKK